MTTKLFTAGCEYTVEISITRMTSRCDRIKEWCDVYEFGQPGWHKSDVHPMLIKYFKKLIPDGKGGRVFVPLCGKTLDMEWMAGQKVSVVGLEGVRKIIEQFFSEQDLKYTTDESSQLTDGFTKFESAEKNILLYCGDMFNFSSNIGGSFDAIWDRDAIVALDRKDVEAYAKIIQSLLRPGGRCLMEVVEYDVKIMIEEGWTGPYPMIESEIKSFHEPYMTVEHFERGVREMAGYDIHTDYYLLTKI